jgi:hypothetical protein
MISVDDIELWKAKKQVEEEIERFRYNEKVRDVLIATWAILVILTIIGVIIYSKLA